MSIFGNLHKDTASAAFVIPLHELAERTSFVQFAVAHIAQMWHELCSCRQAARILAIFVHFVISRLDLEWGSAPYPASASRRSTRLCACAVLRFLCILPKTLIYRTKIKYRADACICTVFLYNIFQGECGRRFHAASAAEDTAGAVPRALSFAYMSTAAKEVSSPISTRTICISSAPFAVTT